MSSEQTVWSCCWGHCNCHVNCQLILTTFGRQGFFHFFFPFALVRRTVKFPLRFPSPVAFSEAQFSFYSGRLIRPLIESLQHQYLLMDCPLSRLSFQHSNKKRKKPTPRCWLLAYFWHVRSSRLLSIYPCQTFSSSSSFLILICYRFPRNRRKKKRVWLSFSREKKTISRSSGIHSRGLCVSADHFLGAAVPHLFVFVGQRVTIQRLCDWRLSLNRHAMEPAYQQWKRV